MKRSTLANFCLIPLAIIVLAMTLFPGDNTFIEDEPRLIALARDMNARHILSPVSLMGSHNLYYGPVAVWVYQFLLLFTPNPIILTVIHAILFASVTGLALWWLTRSLNITPILAIATMLSPWLWFYFRQLWDNSFCIPISAVLMAAYADFLITRRPWSLRLTIFTAALLPLVHFMSLALLVPLAIHILFTQLRYLLKYRWSLLLILIGVNALGWQYWEYIYSFHDQATGQTFMPDSAVAGWFFPFLGAQHLSSFGLENILGDGWLYKLAMPMPFILVAAQTISLLIFLASWIGMAMSAKSFWRVLRRQAQITPIDQIAAFAFLSLICQILIDGVQRIYGQPHYFNATWIIYVVFAWLALGELLRRCAASFLVRMFIPAYAASLIIVLAAAAFKIHHDGGTRSLHYGSSLAQQMDAAQRLDEFSDRSPVRYDFLQWQHYSDTPNSLRHWLHPAVETGPIRFLVVRYRNEFPDDARLVVDDHVLVAPITGAYHPKDNP